MNPNRPLHDLFEAAMRVLDDSPLLRSVGLYDREALAWEIATALESKPAGTGGEAAHNPEGEPL